jgi:hypothetical protein
MKGLSLTLTVIVIAIALLVTVLVVITIFGGQLSSFLGVLNPWSEEVMAVSLCNQKCATWCQSHVGEKETSWSDVRGTVTYKGEESTCSALGNTLGLPDSCTCGFTGGGGTPGVTPPAAGDTGAACTVTTSPCFFSDKGQSKPRTVATTTCKSRTCNVDCITGTSSDKSGKCA